MRSKKFAVEVKDCNPRDYPDGIEVSITHNGFQWWTTRLDVEEWPEIVTAVESHLETRQVTSQQKPSVGRETKHRPPITGE